MEHPATPPGDAYPTNTGYTPPPYALRSMGAQTIFGTGENLRSLLPPPIGMSPQPLVPPTITLPPNTIQIGPGQFTVLPPGAGMTWAQQVAAGIQNPVQPPPPPS